MQTLASKAIRGTALSVLTRVLTRGLDVLTLIVLARLLSPRDFGLVAIGTTLITIAEAILDLPLVSILTREPEIRRSHLDTSFTLSVARGVILAAVAGLAAVPAAILFHDHRLAPVIGFLIFGPIFRGAQSPRLVERFRSISFGTTSLIEIIGKLFGLAVGLIIALAFRSYWALVAIAVINPAAMVIASYSIMPYRPRFSLREWTTFSYFLKWSSAAQLITAASWQCDRLMLGPFVPQAALGRFSLASTIAALPDQAAIKPLGAPLLSTFSQVNSDHTRLARAYLSASRALMMVGVPALVSLSAFAVPMTTLVLGGGKWATAAPLIQALALTVIFAFPAAPLPALALAVGEAKLFASRSFAEFLVQIPCVLILTALFGVTGAIVAKPIVGTYMLAISALMVKRLSGATLLQQVVSLRESMVAGFAMFACLFVWNGFLPWPSSPPVLLLQVIARFSCALLVYSGVYSLIWNVGGCPEGLERRAINLVRSRMTG